MIYHVFISLYMIIYSLYHDVIFYYSLCYIILLSSVVFYYSLLHVVYLLSNYFVLYCVTLPLYSFFNSLLPFFSDPFFIPYSILFAVMFYSSVAFSVILPSILLYVTFIYTITLSSLFIISLIL